MLLLSLNEIGQATHTDFLMIAMSFSMSGYYHLYLMHTNIKNPSDAV
jgi:hypothetical protein